MIGDTLGNSAGDRDGEDVRIAVVLPRKRESVPVGRESDERLDPLSAGKPVRDPSISADRPEVTGVRENDLVLVHRGLLEKVDARCKRARHERNCNEKLHILITPWKLSVA